MTANYDLKKWTAPFLNNLETADAPVLVTIFTSLSAELARLSNLIIDLDARITTTNATAVTDRATVAAIRTALTTLEGVVATCCAGTTTTPAPTTTTTTTTTAAPGATTTPAPATTTTTVATTTTTVAPGVSCTSCTQTAVSQLNGLGQCRYGTAYDGTCQPVGCVGCACPIITIWGEWGPCFE